MAWAYPTFFPVVTLLSWWLWWLGNGCCWYKYSQLQRFIHSLQSQPSLQWSQWQLNGVTHHEGNTRKTSAMSYELARHLNYSNNFLNTQSSDDLSWLAMVGGWNNQIKTLSPGLLTSLTHSFIGVERWPSDQRNLCLPQSCQASESCDVVMMSSLPPPPLLRWTPLP